MKTLWLAIALVWLPSLAGAQAPADSTWPSYGNDPGGGRYSPLAQIDRSNVMRLRVAWTLRTGALQPETPLNRKAAFEATPILVEGKLFLSTPFNQVFALDPATGAKLWEHDVKLDRSRNYSEVTSRGVSAWRDTMAAPGARCRLRIFMGTLDARLVVLDGETGTPCGDFGVDGQVDLTRGVDLRDLGQYQVTSAPAIAGDLVIVGSSIGDNRAVDVERGIVRAFDARSGALRWSWDPDSLGQPHHAAHRRRQRVVDAVGRCGARPRLRPDGKPEHGSLRRRPQGRQPVGQLGRRPACGHR